ncbi:hypothetical protein ACI1UN_05790 [Lactococcus petauri]|uniref:Uncharacterized protein n=1 Tax=Lactococcus formosensis TaxID=1281486 RepID=A0A9X4P532_9LACT|nr:hypothetical protein [Lactococcus formosensis]MDG6142734.1 hypothetical protein [Lactococcus formosensis]MDG6155945.1 hypothetical protein [Lactococcus formosensis]MDG6159839.1 hypothetical protein [Lactococcus formosensis]MDG6166209.1 hypothetical protein [Lactococcus formosensis]MDG6172507.1 hypothetical protein [Lactococcus formosensis]
MTIYNKVKAKRESFCSPFFEKEERKHEKILFGIGLTGVLIMGLAGCTKNDSTQLQSDENIESVNNPEFVAKRFLSWVYEGRSTDIEKIIGIDYSHFQDEQIEFFEERAGSVTPCSISSRN